MAVLGLMSGTSLDGLDMAVCEFESTASGYTFSILEARTVDYSAEWKQLLAGIKDSSAQQYFALHTRYGQFIAQAVNSFLEETGQKPVAIASHGHTVFHQPAAGFSTQAGCGATIAALTGLTTVCDFRSLDVANGGQGAPLVPIGDKFLFAQYDACLNIGGIGNISFDGTHHRRVAYDVCEANMLLNYLAEKTGQAFDRGGEMARSGSVATKLLEALNQQDFYAREGARSIGREWFEQAILPLIEKEKLPVNDLLATATEHVAHILAAELSARNLKNVLVTGGGAYNTFLLERVRSKTSCELILPSNEIINFKEALIFAFLGYLRLTQQVNTLSSVTGARSDSIGGAVYTGTAAARDKNSAV